MEFNWAPGSAGNESVFTRLFHRHYSDTKYLVSDNFYCRSIFCKGKLSSLEKGKATNHINEIKKQVKSNHVIMMMCDDFLFTAGS